MKPRLLAPLMFALTALCAAPVLAAPPKAPYDVFPEAKPPYYRVRYDASTKPGELRFSVNYTIWIPEGVERLRGVVVHQHGSGRNASFDVTHSTRMRAELGSRRGIHAVARTGERRTRISRWCSKKPRQARRLLLLTVDTPKAAWSSFLGGFQKS